MNINIHPIPAFNDNYIWALMIGKYTVIIDPGDAIPVKKYLQEQALTLKAILITHHHGDHTGGINTLKQEYNVPVFGPAFEDIQAVNMPVQEADEVMIADFPLHFYIMNIRGHTADHIAYYANGCLFCGDTLFAGGCGRVFEGTMDEMYHSLKKIAALPDETKIYCAHEYTLNNLRFAQLVEPDNLNIATRMQQIRELRKNNLPTLPSILNEEKKTNPFLRCHVPAVIAACEQHAGLRLQTPVEVFTCLREWKDKFN